MDRKKYQSRLQPECVYFLGIHTIPIENVPDLRRFDDGLFRVWTIESPKMDIFMRQQIEPVYLTLQQRLDDMSMTPGEGLKTLSLLFATKARSATEEEIKVWLQGHLSQKRKLEAA